MLKSTKLCAIGLLISLAGCEKPVNHAQVAVKSPVDYVDPFIGTDGKGKTYPGATVPYGMIQLSPDNGRNGWDWISGYFYPDTVIAGFSHTHLSGTGAGDLYDISFMPYTGTPIYQKLDDINPNKTLISSFSHARESASPGYYQVELADYQVKVELTSGLRTGVQKYTFSKPDSDAHVQLDLGYTRNWDKATATHIEIVDNQTIRGYRKSTGWAEDQRVYFYSRFSVPFSQVSLFEGKQATDNHQTKGVASRADFNFKATNSVVIATALSSVSMDNAKLNLQSEITDIASSSLFERTRQKARSDWLQELSKVEIDTSEDNKVQFYTALYHTALAPRVFSDVNGQYKGPDGNIHQNKQHRRFEFFSLWDTFRALHPWKTITHPEQTQEIMTSLTAHYQEYGLLPVWNFQGNETDMMMGYHAVPVLADAYLKGQLDIDGEALLEMMLKSAKQQNFGIGDYQKYGFVPHETMTWNVSRTLEYAFDDYAIARVAEKLGKTEIQKEFDQRAQNYQTHFDQQTGLMRAKSIQGDFKQPFDPLAYHPEDYCEANAWQYSFFVPHDVEGLMALYPSKQAFIAKLDEMFATEQAGDELPEWISGYIGQYVHGNEPAHHVPYLYRMAGVPHKGEAVLRRVMDEFYTTKPDGLCGNEDAGQMSAWYLFSALGFYPVNPVSGDYVFGSPEVNSATIKLPNNKTFHIQVDNQSEDNVYVDEIWLNNNKVTTDILSHQQLMQGGTLRFVMTNNPASQ